MTYKSTQKLMDDSQDMIKSLVDKHKDKSDDYVISFRIFIPDKKKDIKLYKTVNSTVGRLRELSTKYK